MRFVRKPFATSAVAVAVLAATAAAHAHHGWGWAEEEFSEISGVIEDIYLGNPHSHLDVDVDGEVWRVDLAPPRQTSGSGFDEDAAAAGDEVTAVGHRSRDPQERVFKAVRLVVGDVTYDIYPRRVPSN